MADVQAVTADEKLATGDSGPQVEELQRRLWYLGHYRGQIDGYYGDATVTAVEQFQQSAGVLEDGSGAQTWERLESDAESAGYDKHADHSAEPGAGADIGTDTGSEYTGTEAAEGGDENRHWDGTQWLEWDGASWVPAESGERQVDATEQSSAQVGRLSEDGLWQWDGEGWVATQPAIESGTESGTEAGADEAPSASQPVEAGDGQEAKPWSREVMDEIDSPDTEAAPLPSVTV